MIANSGYASGHEPISVASGALKDARVEALASAIRRGTAREHIVEPKLAAEAVRFEPLSSDRPRVGYRSMSWVASLPGCKSYRHTSLTHILQG